MGDHIKRDDELTEKELQQHSGGRKASRTNEPLRQGSLPEPDPPLTTQAVGEEEDEGDKVRYTL